MQDRPGRLLTQRLLALFAAGWLLLSFPLLKLWLADTAVPGLPQLPLLPFALFTAWALVIALLAVLMETRTG
jgi:hypothetical protein